MTRFEDKKLTLNNVNAHLFFYYIHKNITKIGIQLLIVNIQNLQNSLAPSKLCNFNI